VISVTLLTALGGVAHTASAATSSKTHPAPPPSKTASNTTLTASPSTVATGDTVTLTAAVFPGIFVVPPASVVFTDTTTQTTLGTATVKKKCVLIKNECMLSITVPATSLAEGANSITGSYSGGLGTLPSSGTVIVTRTDSNPTVTTTCEAGSSQCVTPVDNSVDGTAAATIGTFTTNSQDETISVSFQTDELPCSTPDTGDPLVFSSTNAPSSKIVTYTVFGTAADIANAAYGTAGNICFGSPEKFITKGFGPPVLGSDGLYYGLLPECSPNEVVPPCAESASFQAGGEDGEDEYTQTAVVTANDPRMGH
jgi:hypothetical protein